MKEKLRDFFATDEIDADDGVFIDKNEIKNPKKFGTMSIIFALSFFCVNNSNSIYRIA